MGGEGTALVKSLKKSERGGKGALSPCGLVLKPFSCLASLWLEGGVCSESRTDDEAKSGGSDSNLTLIKLVLVSGALCPQHNQDQLFLGEIVVRAPE